jgi:hypothetical protein
MQLINGTPQALPGSCYLCSSATRKRYIDLNTQVEFHGAMYLCEECITAMGDELGLLSTKKADRLRSENKRLRDIIEVHEEENKAIKKVLDGYSDVRAFIGSDSDSSDGATVAEFSLSEREDSVDGGEEGPSKPSNDEGVDDVRTTDDVDESVKF